MHVSLRALHITGRLAQLVERPLSMREAGGSIPPVSIFVFEPFFGSRPFEKFLGVIRVYAQTVFGSKKTGQVGSSHHFFDF